MFSQFNVLASSLLEPTPFIRAGFSFQNFPPKEEGPDFSNKKGGVDERGG